MNPVILSAARTPMGCLLGAFKALSAVSLGSVALKAAITRAGLAPEAVEEVIMGCVLPAGLGQAPARQVALKAGLPVSVDCTTVNKVCGSGMKAIMLACQSIQTGSHKVVAAGGMESMTNVPHLVRLRAGIKAGHASMIDHMFYDGLEDAYESGKLMAVFAEDCALKYHFSRDAQDDYAKTSLLRAINATRNGDFKEEIAPVAISTKAGEVTITTDEAPLKANPDKIPTLKPAFKKDGTITAANASSISDGAACLILSSDHYANTHGLKPMASILGFCTHSQDPAWFTTAPIFAIQSLLKQLNWTIDEVDLFEINEAFACVAMAAMQDLGIPHDKLNIHGGACALGHPIGASGARILVTLLYALKHKGLKRGIAALCIGGGEATAAAVELL